jgi:prolyl oligopeptidase
MLIIPLPHPSFTPRPGLAVVLPLLAALMSLVLLPGCATPRRLVRAAYPPTAITNQVDDYFGAKVADPYRWLEDDNAPATKAWVAAENRVTFDYLARIPQRAALQRRLTALWNYERYGIPFKQGGRYFYFKNNGLQNQSVLYTLTALDAEPRLLLDPNTLSADGTVALGGSAVSDDGNYLAYGLATAGSDWQEWRVRDVRTGADLADRLQWV